VVGAYNSSNVSFTPIANTLMGMSEQLYDYGIYYASKRFFDPSTDRQILFGWVMDASGSGHTDPYSTTWASTQSLPRSVSLDADGRPLRIEYSFKLIDALYALIISISH
jgi:beta-fructofuranosidase